MPNQYAGRKRAAYQAALDEWLGDPAVLHVYTVFSKQETMVGSFKAPRAITAHSKELNVQVWPMIHAFERSLLSIRDLDGLPFFAKGANFEERATVVMEKARDKVVFSLDMSSFDNSIRGGFFDGELDAFGALFGYDFDRSWYDQAVSVLGFGTKRQPTERCRRSGDLQTGCGNCAVMYFYCTRV